MTVPVRASERDLRILAGIVSGDRNDLPAEGLPLSLLSDLLDQIHCDDVSLFRLDSGRQEVRFPQYLPDDEDDGDDDQVFWEHYWDCAPCSYPDRRADLRSVTKISSSTRSGSGTPPACTATISGPPGPSMSSCCACHPGACGPPYPGRAYG